MLCCVSYELVHSSVLPVISLAVSFFNADSQSGVVKRTVRCSECVVLGDKTVSPRGRPVHERARTWSPGVLRADPSGVELLNRGWLLCSLCGCGCASRVSYPPSRSRRKDTHMTHAPPSFNTHILTRQKRRPWRAGTYHCISMRRPVDQSTECMQSLLIPQER